MTPRATIIGLFVAISPALHSVPLNADAVYQKRVNIITSDYDLLDTTYIDRGRIDKVKVGDRFEVASRNGKSVTLVVVTGVFDRMAAVKIVDSQLLKDGQIAQFKNKPEMLAFDNPMRRPSPDMTVKAQLEKKAPAPSPTTAAPAAPIAAAPAMPAGPDAPAAPSAALPAAPTAGLPAAPDAGLPPAPGAGLPAAPGAPDAGLPAAPGGLPAAPDAGLPPAPAAGLPAAPGAPDAGLPAAPGGLPAAPDAGLPAAPGGLPAAPGAPDAGLPAAPGAPAVPTDAPPDVPAPPAF